MIVTFTAQVSGEPGPGQRPSVGLLGRAEPVESSGVLCRGRLAIFLADTSKSGVGARQPGAPVHQRLPQAASES